MPVLVFDSVSTGHRGNYVSTFARLLEGEALIGSPWRNFTRLLLAPRLLLPTLETSPRFYAVLAFLRSLLFRRTVLFVLRPHLPEQGPMRWMKVLTHRLLSILPGVRLATIFKLPPDSHLAGRAMLIRDLEYWDLAGQPPPAPTALSDRVKGAANGRKIIVSLGWFSEDKGGCMLLDIFSEPIIAERFMLVVAGMAEPEMATRLAAISRSGLIVENRMIDDDELLSLYSVADLSWCCYAPERDISSGVFGRSLQFDVPTIVREDSLLQRQMDEFGFGVAVPWLRPDAAAERIVAWLDEPARETRNPSTGLANEFNAETELRKLRMLLGQQDRRPDALPARRKR